MFLVLIFVVQLESLPLMVFGVWSTDSNLQLEATTQFRKLLSIGIFNLCILIDDVLCKIWMWLIIYVYWWNFGITERSPPFEEVIQFRVVPRFVEFLVREDCLYVGVFDFRERWTMLFPLHFFFKFLIIFFFSFNYEFYKFFFFLKAKTASFWLT